MSITNYTEMVEAIQSWLNRQGLMSLDEEIPNFIAFGQNRIMYDVDLKAMEAIEDPFPIAAQVTPLPADLLRIRSIWIADAINTRPIEGAPLQRVIAYREPDRPIHYETVGTDLYVGPTPDQSYDGVLSYYRALPILTETEPTNWFTDNYPELLLSASLYEALLWLKDDARAQIWGQQYERIKTTLENSEARQARPYGGTAGARLA